MYLVSCEANVMGIKRTLYYDINDFPRSAALQRGFIQVLREEWLALARQNDSDVTSAMDTAQYFTTNALVKMYPVLGYLANCDNQLLIGKRCATVGTVQNPLYLLKVGEAISNNEDDSWKCGIYRLASVMMPGEEDESESETEKG